MINKKLKGLIMLSYLPVISFVIWFVIVSVGTEGFYLSLKYPDVITMDRFFLISVIMSSALLVYSVASFLQAALYNSLSIMISARSLKIAILLAVIGALIQLTFNSYYYGELDKKGYVRCNNYSRGPQFVIYAKEKYLCYQGKKKHTVPDKPVKNRKWR